MNDRDLKQNELAELYPEFREALNDAKRSQEAVPKPSKPARRVNREPRPRRDLFQIFRDLENGFLEFDEE